MPLVIEVENIKCGGCVNSIRKKLLNEDLVSDVQIDIDNQLITIDAPDTAIDLLKYKLHTMGYPEKGTAHGFDAATTKAKSFVSCAIGRLSDDVA